MMVQDLFVEKCYLVLEWINEFNNLFHLLDIFSEKKKCPRKDRIIVLEGS